MNDAPAMIALVMVGVLLLVFILAVLTCIGDTLRAILQELRSRPRGETDESAWWKRN